jgi:RNA polymerase-associated protein RTF1
MLARKSQINATRHSAASLTMERSRLNQARTLALRRQDYEEMATIDAQLAELAASNPVAQAREDDRTDILAKVNERNRKANLEAVRKAEQAEVERKRRERRLAAAARATASPTPSALLAVRNGISRSVSAISVLENLGPYFSCALQTGNTEYKRKSHNPNSCFTVAVFNFTKHH